MFNNQIKMKKLLLLLLPFSSQAQTCPPLQCTGHQVTVNGTMTNANYNGNTCFTGSGTVSNSVSVNNWQKLSWSGNINYQQTVNFSPNSKAWVASGSNISLPQVSFTNNDTLWNFGNLVIASYNSNNSFTNTIINGQGATLKIGNTYYNTPQVINMVPSNPTNVLVIGSCGASPLPITLEYFISNPLRWKFSDVSDLYKVELQWSKDGLDWLSEAEYLWVRANFEYLSLLGETGLYRLKMTTNTNTTSFSKVLKLMAKTKEQGLKYNLLGQLATDQDQMYIQNHKLYYKHD